MRSVDCFTRIQTRSQAKSVSTQPNHSSGDNKVIDCSVRLRTIGIIVSKMDDKWPQMALMSGTDEVVATDSAKTQFYAEFCSKFM